MFTTIFVAQIDEKRYTFFAFQHLSASVLWQKGHIYSSCFSYTLLTTNHSARIFCGRKVYLCYKTT